MNRWNKTELPLPSDLDDLPSLRSNEERLEAPIDFSLKRRSSFDGKLSDERFVDSNDVKSSFKKHIKTRSNIVRYDRRRFRRHSMIRILDL